MPAYRGASAVRHHSSMSCVLGAAAGDVYEHAVLVALKSQNEDMQEHAFTQLKTFYDDTR
jgi:hypothetical protein